MTVFYVLLYHIARQRCRFAEKKGLALAVYLLAVIRIVLGFFPQNNWTSPHAPLVWGIYRNVPFALLGVLILVVFYQQAKKHKDRSFRFVWLAVALSFAFYIPVVLWADAIPTVGVLMIPKTCAYVWLVWMGYQDMKARQATGQTTFGGA